MKLGGNLDLNYEILQYKNNNNTEILRKKLKELSMKYYIIKHIFLQSKFAIKFYYKLLNNINQKWSINAYHW